jgi:hypothetical protein
LVSFLVLAVVVWPLNLPVTVTVIALPARLPDS